MNREARLERRPADLEDRTFDVVVVGGGILGSCAARDAALRGLSVALLEREDFGHATSANSLKIVHGGLRYLQHADLRRFRESVRERRTWLRLAPHLVEPLPVVFPTRGRGSRSRGALRAAVAVSDLLASDRNREVEGDRWIPAGRGLTRAEVGARVPELDRESITGGILFHDALIHAPERLVLEVVKGAVAAGAVAANYVEVRGALREGGRLVGVVAVDRLAHDEVVVRARTVLNAAGAGTDAVARRLVDPVRFSSPLPPEGAPSPPAPGWSSAVNVVVDGLGHRDAFALPARPPERSRARPAPGSEHDQPQLFVVPWRGRTLVGTGHYPLPGGGGGAFGGDRGRDACRAEATERFVDEVARAWPSPHPLPTDGLRLVHWGLLPTASPGNDHGRGPVRLLKRQRVVDHAPDGAPGVVSVVGVKFTTARRAAEQAVDRICHHLRHRRGSGLSAHTPLPATPAGPLRDLLEAAERDHQTVERALLHHLVRTYGAGVGAVLRLIREHPEGATPVTPDDPTVRAQLLHGARNEMAVSPRDLVWRRTQLGPRGEAGGEALLAARRAMETARAAP